MAEDENILHEFDNAPLPLHPLSNGCWRILHISDLHFQKPVHRLLRNRAIPQRHDIHLLRGLRTALHQDLQGVDLVVVSGDISTNGSTRSLTLAKDFFGDGFVHEIKSYRSYLEHKEYGLGLNPESILAVPGNHDRYRYVPLQVARASRFEDVLCDDEEGRRRFPRHVRIVDATAGVEQGAPPLDFWLFDSTLSGKVLPRLVNPLDRAAKGYLSPEETGKMGDKRSQNEIRIVVLHHHPTLSDAAKKAAQRLSQWERLRSPFTTMISAEDACTVFQQKEVDLVLYGHRHVRDFAPSEGSSTSSASPYFFCSRSTTEEKGRRKNQVERRAGFWVYELSRDRLLAKDYVWTKGRFRRQEEPVERQFA